MITKPRRLLVSAMSLVLLGTAACSSSGKGGGQATASSSSTGAQATGSTYTVYNLNDDSTIQPAKDILATGRAAVDYVNSHGGVHGHKLAIKFCSGGLDANQSQACARKVIADPSAVATVGDFMTNGQGAWTALCGAGLSELAPFAIQSEQFTCKTSFPVIGGLVVAGAEVEDILTDVKGVKKFAFVGVDVPANRASPTLLNTYLKSSGRDAQVTKSIFVPNTTADFTSVVAELQSSHVDGILLGVPELQQISLIRAAASQGLDLPFGSSLSGLPESDLKTLGSAAKNVYTASLFDLSTDMYKSFADAQSKFPSLPQKNDDAANLWAGVLMFASIAKDLPTVTRATVTQAASKLTTYDTQMGAVADFTKPYTGVGGAFPRMFNPSFYYYKWDGSKLQPLLGGKKFSLLTKP